MFTNFALIHERSIVKTSSKQVITLNVKIHQKVYVFQYLLGLFLPDFSLYFLVNLKKLIQVLIRPRKNSNK